MRVDAREIGVSVVEFETEVKHKLDHQAKMMGFPGPVLVMHTRNDGLVDVSHGQRLYDWASGKKTLKIFPQGNHNDIMYVNAREYFAALATFIADLET